MRSSITKVAAAAAPLALLIPLTACRGVVAAAAGNSATVAGPGAAATAATAASQQAAPLASTAAGTTAAAAGTLVVSMTSPVTESGTAAATVTCARTAVLYLASANNAQVAGYDHSFSLRIGRYNGPGTYPGALLTFTVTGPNGGIASTSGILATPVTITSTGGTFTVDRTGPDGKTLDATVTWTCS
jgi:hypothetical protein